MLVPSIPLNWPSSSPKESEPCPFRLFGNRTDSSLRWRVPGPRTSTSTWISTCWTPEHFPSLSCPEPGGLHPEQLRAALRALAERFHLAGLGVTEHAPAADSAGSDQVLQGILDRLAIP
ncbi:arginase family protein [Streptomyces echinatus]|uniref:arginase family protein n=1 Tax=Streptomyces echinatus TaxID=67293 RepID=UPI0031E58C35